MNTAISRAAVISACAIPCFSSYASAQEYAFEVDPDATTATGAVSADISTSGTLIGDWDPVDNPGGTRTKPTGNIFDFPGATENSPVNTSIGLGTNATLGGTQATGAFGLTLDGSDVSVDGLALDLLSGGSLSAPVNAAISFETFTTAAPNSFYPGVPVNLPLGEASISALTLAQAGGPATGTATPTGAFTFDISVQIPVLVAGSASFQGETVPLAAIPFNLVFIGELTQGFGVAALTGQFDFDVDDNAMVDIALPEIPFELPTITGGEAGVLLSLTADQLAFDIDAGVTLGAEGVVIPAPGAVCVFGLLLVGRRRRSC